MLIRFESFFNLQGSGPKPVIDRAAGVIQNVCAMHEGEALGHGISADNETLNIMARLGNLSPKGIRGRFGHPGMSENATGKQVQVASDFSVYDDKLLHTSYLLTSARKSPVFTQDPVEFILDLAENNPTQFGESVVINSDLVWILEDGNERGLSDDEISDVGYGLKPPEDATNDLPVMRPSEFHYVDFVNEGALTHNGLFNANPYLITGFNSIFAPGKSSYFAKEVFQFLDEWRKAYKVDLETLQQLAPKKIAQIMAAYVAYRQKESKLVMSKKLVEEIVEDKLLETGPADELEAQAGSDAESGDGLLSDLAETQAIMTELEADLTEDSDADRQAILAAIVDLQGGMGELQQTVANQVESMRQYIAELSKAVVGQARLLQIMDKKIKSLAGERVLTKAVARSPQTPLEDLVGIGAFSFESGITPATAEIDEALGNTETTSAKLRGRDLTAAAWANRQRIDSGQ